MQKKILNNKIIIDNLCSQQEADVIKDIFYGEHFPWYFKNYVVDETMILPGTENHQYQFTHHLVREDGRLVTEEQYWQPLFPIFNRIHPNTFIRIKANLVPRAEKLITHGFHVDCMVPFSITGIYYCNTNNGYTEFEDGDKIESVHNRLVLFPSNMKHSGSTCTDATSRVALNINFMPRYTENSMYKEILDPKVWQQIDEWCSKCN